MIYVVDIDGTIFNSPSSNYTLSTPIKERIERINTLFDEGNTIIYWTARGAKSGKDWKVFTEDQLYHYGCKYTELRMSKPHYDVWIDDKAFNAEYYFNKG